MNISDWIQLIVGIITGCGILSSIIISVKTLNQSNEMIEESTRPNVIIYKDTLDINSPLEYLVIKNIGNSLAYITSIKFNLNPLKSMGKPYSEKSIQAFKQLNNSCLAPNQFYKIPIKTMNINTNTMTFKISYTNKIKSYYEEFKIYLKQDKNVSFIKQHQPNNELKVISNAIQELIKRIS